MIHNVIKPPIVRVFNIIIFAELSCIEGGLDYFLSNNSNMVALEEIFRKM